MRTTTQLTVTLPTDMVRRLDAVAQREARTRSNLLRRLVQEALTKPPEPKSPSISKDPNH